jgi:hypothetical protein
MLVKQLPAEEVDNVSANQRLKQTSLISNHFKKIQHFSLGPIEEHL